MSLAIERDDHKAYLQLALSQASQSPLRDTNFRVGAVLVNLPQNTVVATGYTMELPGNTHAEQCVFMKLASIHSVSEEDLPTVMALQEPHALYTTMEPCSKRLSENRPCVDGILLQRLWIKKVFFGVPEPHTFVHENTGRKTLREAGVEPIHVHGLEETILAVATAGHRGHSKT
jgi:pyrimidine deaminase RibD-like protein